MVYFDSILDGYRRGIFPMAKSKDSREIMWVKPIERGVIPVGQLHISKSMRKHIKSRLITNTINNCFEEVVRRCADRPDTWINNDLSKFYKELYARGYAFSIEIWSHEKLIGGLFGICIGSCFCGESMFSSEPNGSKLALIVTMARLIYNKFKLFDTQFPSDHLKSMGGCTITQACYEKRLLACINDNQSLLQLPKNYSWVEILQLNNHKL